MKRTIILTALALCVAGTAGAQAREIETKTIELKQLKPSEAVKLLRPYIVNGGGGVFEVSDKLPIITIKDISTNIPVLEQVLAKYDRSPATIRLVFQLIEADTGPRLTAASNTRQQVPMELDSTLRSVLKFPAYRVLSQGMATVGEMTEASQQLGEAGDGMVFKLFTRVGSIRADDASGSVNLDVQLWREGFPVAGNQTAPRDWVISTRVDVPLGNTVVLGTAATRTKGVALILAVRPELVSTGK